MELPQPSRPFTAEGRKATHDFLSLYGNSPVQQDQQPSSHGAYLKTQNFLQPLDKEDQRSDNANVHVSYLNPRMPKSEGTAFNMASPLTVNDEHSNASSYNAGNSFTVWDHESSSRKGKTGKETPDDLNLTKDARARTGQWPIERPSDSSSNHPYGLSFRSSSQPPPAHTNQSFVQMLIAAKIPHAKEEDEDEVFTLRNEGSFQKGELQIKVDGRTSNDQKANTPRSKHSATEQRRRCKINDRFQALRKIIPNSDQKRDKASFLLEVIEYIQFLQEKVSKYEGYPGYSSEPMKLSPMRSSADQPGTINEPVLMLKPDNKNNILTSNFQRMQQLPLTVSNNLITLNSMDQHTKLPNTPPSFPIPQLQTDIFPSFRENNVILQPIPCKPPASHPVDTPPIPQLQLHHQTRPEPSDYDSKTSNQEIALEGGSINISSIYSQGLLNTLTHALKSSGVDVSQANISVQVDIGKQTNLLQNCHKTRKGFDINCESMDIEESNSNHNPEKRLKRVKS